MHGAKPSDGHFTGAADVSGQFVLESSIERVAWTPTVATAGAVPRLEVLTRHVGDGAPLSVEVSDLSGRPLWRASDALAGGRFHCDVPLPATMDPSVTAVVAMVRLPRHALDGSALLAIEPPVRLTGATWGRQEAHRGDRVSLVAGLRDAAEGSAVAVQVYRQGADGIDEALGEPLPALVVGQRVEAEWTVPDDVRPAPGTGAPAPAAVYYRLRFERPPESAPSMLLYVADAPAPA